MVFMCCAYSWCMSLVTSELHRGPCSGVPCFCDHALLLLHSAVPARKGLVRHSKTTALLSALLEFMTLCIAVMQ